MVNNTQLKTTSKSQKLNRSWQPLAPLTLQLLFAMVKGLHCSYITCVTCITMLMLPFYFTSLSYTNSGLLNISFRVVQVARRKASDSITLHVICFTTFSFLFIHSMAWRKKESVELMVCAHFQTCRGSQNSTFKHVPWNNGTKHSN